MIPARLRINVFLACCLLLLVGCAPRVALFSGGPADPLVEYTLSGEGTDKILLLPVRGVLDNEPDRSMFGERPSTVQEAVARLEKARKDPALKAVVLSIDSPGGTSADSETLYHEVMRFKQDTGIPVAAMLMNLATSGGYYLAAAADTIVAHPATITGSIGTIFIRPDVTGLMEMIGVQADVAKTGEHKDMSSPFRDASEKERAIIQSIIDEHNARFLEAVRQSRNLTDAQLEAVADARIMAATQAVDMGLADGVGHLQDCFARARALASLEPDAGRIVVYRRNEYKDDTVYNPSTAIGPGAAPSLLGSSLSRYLAAPRTGVYHLWAPEWTGE